VDQVGPDPTLPAACAECIDATVPALPGAALVASVVRRFRDAEGRLRVDFATFSTITDPVTGERILLDHLAQEARILAGKVPIPPQLPVPGIPGLPAAPGLPPAPNLVALGKLTVEGMAVEGVRHIFAAIDGMLPPITSWEVWTNTALQMPVFTQTIGGFGVRTCICKCAAVEPPASAFQIPANYTVVRGI
jgi:hypothetical protein